MMWILKLVLRVPDGGGTDLAHCGICASDLHVLRSGWGPTDYPTVVGHEIIGYAVKLGKNVQGINLGDRVGVGAQSDSCHHCEECVNRPRALVAWLS
jgi:D-arabinose 1-dehydrogenase-like Zn-dependent alcohol dehydrogenase